jgi:hypothetical protein
LFVASGPLPVWQPSKEQIVKQIFGKSIQLSSNLGLFLIIQTFTMHALNQSFEYLERRSFARKLDLGGNPSRQVGSLTSY